jgi:hypothetical protein
MYLVIPTKETQQLRSSLAKGGESIGEKIAQAWTGAGGKTVQTADELMRGVEGQSMAAMKAANLAVYRLSSESRMFERISLR